MRECGECTVCCTVAEIREGDIQSPAGSPCEKLCADGCSIYGKPERPKICVGFGCAWLRGLGEIQDRPDLIGAMFSLNTTPRGLVGFVIETEPNAIRFMAREMAIAFAELCELPLIVSKYGSKPPNDKGDFVVLLESLERKAAAILGRKVTALSGKVNLYQFMRSA